MRQRLFKYRWIAMLCTAAILMATQASAPHSSAKGMVDRDQVSELTGLTLRENGYEQYRLQHQDKPMPDETIVVRATSYERADGMKPGLYRDSNAAEDGALLTDETGMMTWAFDVPEAGLYYISVRYYNVPGKNTDIERALYINGELPFAESGSIYLQRRWKNAGAGIQRDERGNDIRPVQAEESGWQDVQLRDMTGYYEEPYLFYFHKGGNTLSLASLREPVVIESLTLHQSESTIDYKDQLNIYEQQDLKVVDRSIVIKKQGEDAEWKSSPTLYPIMERSPTSEPYHVSKIRLNAIGGNNWRMPGQWMEWEIDIPEDGLYQLAFKAKQSYARGLTSTRALTIDGKTPFREMERVSFPYGPDWGMHILRNEDDGEPYLFHFTKGKHAIRLEVTLGEMAPVLRTAESSVLALNELYRTIISFTGTVPDPFRDYQLDERLPEMPGIMERQSAVLASLADMMEGYSGKTTDRTAILRTISYQLSDMAKEPDSVPSRLERFKTNVGAVSTWILQVKEQPLSIDYLIASSPDSKLPKAKASWWQKAVHELSAFGASFIEDYDSIGQVHEDAQKPIAVWVTTGRDQAQIVKRMIDNDFTVKSGVPVNLRLVSADVLLAATLAGQGPDVAIQVGNDVPVNFAMRSALYDLSAFPDFEEVSQRFHESAVVPYRYNEGVFALPEQQIFPVLFYRKDILNELGLEVPQTWDDVYAMIPHLQKNNLEFGLPQQTVSSAGTGVTQQLPPNPAFAMLLYQHDGELYREGGMASAIDAEPSVQAFRKWTELYVNYKLPIMFDFPNRFRTGEMPIGIAEYDTYNHLSVSAPEIRGLWGFAPVPGVRTAEGEIRREVSSRGFGAIMFQQTEDKEAAWEFLKWWTDKDAQIAFGREMEGLLGPAGRYPAAHVEALEQLPWPVADLNVLKEQWRWVRGIPEVPGGYFTGRHLDNAFRRVVIGGDDARETIDLYVRAINEEITIKRKEFNLPLTN
ncbi:extracellular solute-binding protein [Paenibacillus sp. J5C_2022]|uniref:extracellular solute-binding protein n=1 Tax=Paenibacillus sp. J5C2022 TaxID=2977129 RepID=UPI0021D35B44|nr:extracellular solute-binding protein [Paenibacillus sp. J5C2022]MCU6712345.1 extracellular solute-binding protein [Paenibacillus sp. J5C2022]